MAKTNFVELAPQLIQEAFAQVGAQATSGQEFIAQHNARYAEVINKVGRTIMNTQEFENKLGFMYSMGMDEGAIVEMVASQVEAWINDTSIKPASLSRDELKQYPSKTLAAYSDLSAVITAPVTIYDKALKQAFKNGTAEQFYAQKLIEMNNSIAYKRYLLGKELINRVLTDDMGESADRYKVVKDVGAIGDKEDALKVWATLRKIIAAFGVNTTKYNKVGYRGQCPAFDAQGNPNILVIGRSDDISDLMSYAADIIHPDLLMKSGVEFKEVDDFGGLVSSIPAEFDEGDGSQKADMSDATWIDPHKDIRFLVCERGTFVATINFDDVETRRDVGSRATTFEPLSAHTYVHIPWKPFVAVAFEDTTKPVASDGEAKRDTTTKATVKFTSDKPGEFFFAVVDGGGQAPTINTDTAGAKCYAGVNTFEATNLTAGAKDIYIVVKDRQGNVSTTPLKVVVAAS